MSDDWKVGDLAVCVDKVPCDDGLEVGKTYCVSGVEGGGIALHLKELPSKPGCSWVASRFRKIRPDEHEPCEEEFVTLLERSKVPLTTALSDFAQATGQSIDLTSLERDERDYLDQFNALALDHAEYRSRLEALAERIGA